VPDRFVELTGGSVETEDDDSGRRRLGDFRVDGHSGMAQVRKPRKDRRGPHILSMRGGGDWVPRGINIIDTICTLCPFRWLTYQVLYLFLDAIIVNDTPIGMHGNRQPAQPVRNGALPTQPGQSHSLKIGAFTDFGAVVERPGHDLQTNEPNRMQAINCLRHFRPSPCRG